MMNFQIITQFNFIQIHKKAIELKNYFKAKVIRTGINSYLMVDENYKAYVRISKNGFDISTYENDERFVNKFIGFIEKIFKNMHIAVHIESENSNIKDIIISKGLDIAIL